MTLATPEFIRRFLMHVLPKGFHRIRHAGFLANGNRAEAIAKARELLKVPAAAPATQDTQPADATEPFKLERPCPCCGRRMEFLRCFTRQRPKPQIPCRPGGFDYQARYLMIRLAPELSGSADFPCGFCRHLCARRNARKYCRLAVFLRLLTRLFKQTPAKVPRKNRRLFGLLQNYGLFQPPRCG